MSLGWLAPKTNTPTGSNHLSHVRIYLELRVQRLRENNMASKSATENRLFNFLIS
jgi:hypothetical protein